MKKRHRRPWDPPLASSPAGNHSTTNNSSSEYGVPFVTVGGVRFYSDRFYLNANDIDDWKDNDDHGHEHADCTCGYSGAPPTFNRQKFVAKLDLQAAILGTYTCDPHFLQAAFPSLFSTKEETIMKKKNDDDNNTTKKNCNRSVPTLVLHGDRRLHNRKDHDDDDMDDGRRDPELDDDMDDENHGSHETGEEDRKHLPGSFSNKLSTDWEQDFPPHIYWSEITSTWIPPEHVPVARSQWLATSSKTATTTCKSSTTKPASVSPALVRHRQNLMGVHHPKFMLLFETSGSLVVLVSTANLTRNTNKKKNSSGAAAIEGTWVQRFPPANHPSNPRRNAATGDMGGVLRHLLEGQTKATRAGHATPLGFVKDVLGWNSLAEFPRRYDFSHAQAHLVATLPGEYPDHDTPRMNEIQTATDAAGAGTDKQTATSTPIKDTGHDQSPLQSPTRRLLSNPTHLTGRQRVRALLQRDLPAALRNNSDNDILILQPTSLGRDWHRGNLAAVLRSYLVCDPNGDGSSKKKDKCNAGSHYLSDVDLLDRTRIVWPTAAWMRRRTVRAASPRRKAQSRGIDNDKRGTAMLRPSPISVAGIPWKQETSSPNGDQRWTSPKVGDRVEASTTSSSDEEQEQPHRSYCFLSSETFNLIDLSCLSRLVHYETSIPPQIDEEQVPHFKSVCRIFQGDDYALRQAHRVPVRSEAIFSYFLMTSACLSRGAQGDPRIATTPVVAATGTKERPHRVVHYANFELGVLFISQLSGQSPPTNDYSQRPNRLYGFRPLTCQCHRQAGCPTQSGTRAATFSTTPFIHLPVPYALHSPFYQQSQNVHLNLDDENDEEGAIHFNETPYFHDIPAGTATVGHMKLTPYGLQATAKAENPSS